MEAITFLPINQPGSPASQRARRGYQSCDNCREKKKRCVTAHGEATCRRCQDESRACLTTHRRKKRKIRPSLGAESLLEAPRVPGPAPAPLPDHDASTKQRILSTHLLDASDALDLIAVAGSKEDVDGDVQSCSSHQDLSSEWRQFFLVKRGILRAEEAVEFLGFYFSTLWHLFPVVPEYYGAPENYTSLATAEPVLTIALIALSSRYHILSGYNGIARSERVHWRTWPWVQKLFQSSIWGSSAMRSHGAIAALLLFIEWHPRAINSSEDFIGDCGELELFEPHCQPDGDSHARPSIPERLNLVATAYRSNKMSWMLLSSAIALARELGVFEGQTVEGSALSQEWTRILRTFIRLADESLALRLRLEPQLAGGHGVADHIPTSMVGDAHWESGVELGIHMCKARELLRSWRKSEAGSGAGAGVPLGAWEGFRRGLDRWKRQREFSNGGADRDLPLRAACLEVEYYYIRLCGLSPAAHIFERLPDMETEGAGALQLAQLASDATTASIDMLHCVLHRLSPTQGFKYAGVKIWLYTVCAALYLLKITLQTEEQLDRSSPRIRLIRGVVDALKQNAPDDVHMAQRYAALLEILINAALRSCAGDPVRQRESSPLYTAMGPEVGIDTAADWIYGSEFWDSLPDMVGLNGVSSLFLPLE
ncbi:Zn(II)2Cys6 transcription factor domain-containing protein [Aspergillus mulundensis]|uniref:Zn(2)-C6 fungal-type domain-containing protein n=1 Tax=Aspergillus mulundensis TaxID=1810919 RepID=A0A3D8SLF2_9EURO|nr:Uncharacterized protein DSM5745_03270 [Aspergillus mulundensis]RDW86628.1 Uncharacterized protein DSM5745_03270 [Aspergillus mulundensis]